MSSTAGQSYAGLNGVSSTTVHLKSFNYYRNTTFIALLLGYMGYYLCRQNFSVAYGPMKESLGIDKLTFGTIASTGTLFYAIGKFLTGSAADSFGGRKIFLLGLFASAIASMVFGLGHGLIFFFVVWSINRFFQSMGWGGLIQVMSRWFEREKRGTAMGFISVSFQLGGALASMYAGLLLAWGADWRGLFIIPSATLLLLGLTLSPFLAGSPQEKGFSPLTPEKGEVEAQKLGYLKRFRVLLSTPSFLVLCLISFTLTLLRECFMLWTPAYFTELGAGPSEAAFQAAFFQMMGCLGTVFTGWYSDRFSKGRREPIMFFFLLALTASLVALGYVKTSTGALIAMGATGFFLLGAYALIAGAMALDVGGRAVSATAAGMLDGVGYLGGIASGYGVAKVVVRSGWSVSFWMMAAVALVTAVFCLWHSRLNRGQKAR